MLKYALSLVLVFVGLKMVWLDDAAGGKVPIGISLGIVGALVSAGIVVSLLVPRRTSEHAIPSATRS